MNHMERNELCWCGSGKKYKKCHLAIEERIAYHEEKGEIVPTRDILKTIPQIEGIKKSARLNTAVLDHVAEHIHAGMSTEEIDRLVYDFTVSHGGIPAPLHYQEFRKVSALQSTMRSATGFRMNPLFWKREISSMWTCQRFWTAIFQMLPECL